MKTGQNVKNLASAEERQTPELLVKSVEKRAASQRDDLFTVREPLRNLVHGDYIANC